jgi:NADH-quinone oxidoreductase subunit C
MENDALKNRLIELLPSLSFTEGSDLTANGWLIVQPDSKDWLILAEQLRNIDDLLFDYLFCLTCIDWQTNLTMIYHLTSTRFRHTIVVKSKLDRSKPEIESVSSIWRTAEFHEREVYEMFGVNFLNHPDLRLLILPEGWEGKNPLRKDFEDPVNMIKL